VIAICRLVCPEVYTQASLVSKAWPVNVSPLEGLLTREWRKYNRVVYNAPNMACSEWLSSLPHPIATKSLQNDRWALDNARLIRILHLPSLGGAGNDVTRMPSIVIWISVARDVELISLRYAATKQYHADANSATHTFLEIFKRSVFPTTRLCICTYRWFGIYSSVWIQDTSIKQAMKKRLALSATCLMSIVNIWHLRISRSPSSFWTKTCF
jgi:hypothetical protein